MTITLETNNGSKNVLEREDYSTEAFVCNVGGFLEPTIQHDTSIEGNGSTADPLGVAISPDAGNAITNPGNGLYAIDYSSVISGFKVGWVEVSDTWTFNSATDVNVPSDATLVYPKGAKIRFKQGGGYKYFNVISRTATVLTIKAGTDYTVANAAITNIAYSLDEVALDFPDTFNFAPGINTQDGTVTPITVIRAEFRVIGSQCWHFLTFDATQNTSDSQYFFYTPPLVPTEIEQGFFAAGISNTGTRVAGYSFISSVAGSGEIRIYHYNNDLITFGGSRSGWVNGGYKYTGS